MRTTWNDLADAVKFTGKDEIGHLPDFENEVVNIWLDRDHIEAYSTERVFILKIADERENGRISDWVEGSGSLQKRNLER